MCARNKLNWQKYDEFKKNITLVLIHLFIHESIDFVDLSLLQVDFYLKSPIANPVVVRF